MDPRSHVRPRQRLALAAEQVNWLNRQMRADSGVRGEAGGDYAAPYTWVLCKNISGVTVPRWGVLEITSVAIEPDAGQQFQMMPVVEGDEPSGEEGASFCIALEPIADGKLGRVAVSGLVQAKVSVDDAGATSARPQEGSVSELVAGDDGVPIVWKDSGNGSDKWALVLLGGGGGGAGASLKLCKTTSDWEYDALADLEVWHDGEPGTEAKSSPTEVVAGVVNKISKVPEDTFVVIGKAGNGAWYLVAIGRSCSYGHTAEWATENSLNAEAGISELTEGDGPQVLMHEAGCLRWVSLKKETVITHVSVDTFALVFERKDIWTFPDSGTAPENIVIEGTECPDAVEE